MAKSTDFIPIVGPIVSGVSSLIGAHESSNAATKAAEAQTAAANHGADVQAQSSREALDFQKAQAAHDADVAEANRHANYDQWAAGQHRLQSVGDLLGDGPREIPAYVPLPRTASGGWTPTELRPGQTPAAPSVGDALGARTPTPAAQPTGGSAVPRGSVGDLLAPPAPMAPSAPGAEMVLLRAPSGAMKAVPADQVEHYLSRGAMRAEAA